MTDETYRQNVLAGAGIKDQFVQDNHSRSSRGVLRGLHYQLRNPQAKLCRVVQGEVLDIAGQGLTARARLNSSGDSESGFLEPLREIVRTGKVPAQVLLDRYLHAWDSKDVEGLVALMKEDAPFTMPPSPSWYRGRAAIRTLLTTQAFAPLAQNRWHFSPTRANGCPAFAVYHATGLGGTFRAFGIQVVTLDDCTPGLLIADVTTFLDPSLLPFFGFPPELSR